MGAFVAGVFCGVLRAGLSANRLLLRVKVVWALRCRHLVRSLATDRFSHVICKREVAVTMEVE